MAAADVAEAADESILRWGDLPTKVVLGNDSTPGRRADSDCEVVTRR
jgi:hypothetical protein